MCRSLIAVVMLACVSTALLLSVVGDASAGDEVDYSAPYLTVENGELVTKYPAKEHDADNAGTPSAPDDPAESPKPGTSLPPLLGFALVGIVVASVVFRLRSRRRNQHAPDADSTD